MSARHPVFLAAILSVMLAPCGCTSLESHRNSHDSVLMTQDANGNFVVMVGNYSRAINPVDIKVYIDGRMAVDGLFEYRFNMGVPWLKTFIFSLPEGRHTVGAETVKGEAQSEQEFEIRGKHWVLIAYCHNPKPRYGTPIPKRFIIQFSDKQPLLM